MAVPVVIDGYNLLYARGEAPSADSRERLVRDLVRWAGRRGRRAVLVFDAWAQGGRVEHEEARGPVTVCFTRYGERADAWIVRRVAARPEAVVVTSDRAVGQAARRRGAAVIGAEAFLVRLEAALSPDAEDESVEPAPTGRRPGRQASWLRGL
jgi:predicted RNA-binding protein with PIN domain